jgi:dimethylhistidine N-methyltransferase
VTGSFRADVLAGLLQAPRSLPSKHFYDAEGSRLFEAITRTPEYYPTRIETALLRQIAPEVARYIGVGGALVEFGSGASVKTRLLLDAAPQLERYVPIDISADALADAAREIEQLYPSLLVEPLVADFTQHLQLSSPVLAASRMGFFPGSTIGNFDPEQATAFLARARKALGPGASFLIGIDLVKSPEVLERAYDDAEGVTKAFNKNVLARINRELGGDLDLDAFEHRAIWNAAESRMEMHLVSRRDQTFTIGEHTVGMAGGEAIHTENSYKFTVDGFLHRAQAAGWRSGPVWRERDPDTAFALVLLTN